MGYGKWFFSVEKLLWKHSSVRCLELLDGTLQGWVFEMHIRTAFPEITLIFDGRFFHSLAWGKFSWPLSPFPTLDLATFSRGGRLDMLSLCLCWGFWSQDFDPKLFLALVIWFFKPRRKRMERFDNECTSV